MKEQRNGFVLPPFHKGAGVAMQPVITSFLNFLPKLSQDSLSPFAFPTQRPLLQGLQTSHEASACFLWTLPASMPKLPTFARGDYFFVACTIKHCCICQSLHLDCRQVAMAPQGKQLCCKSTFVWPFLPFESLLFGFPKLQGLLMAPQPLARLPFFKGCSA